jgi:hypothetical protein
MTHRLQTASWWLVIAKAETCSGSVPPTTSNTNRTDSHLKMRVVGEHCVSLRRSIVRTAGDITRDYPKGGERLSLLASASVLAVWRLSHPLNGGRT